MAAIVAIGEDAEIRAWRAAPREEIDAGGATVLPGFVDAHNHVRLGSNPGAVAARRRDEPGGDPSPDRRVRRRASGRRLDRGRGVELLGDPRRRADRRDARGRRARQGPVPVLLRRAHRVAQPGGDGPAADHAGTGSSCHGEPSSSTSPPGVPTGYIHDFAVLGISEEGQRALGPTSRGTRRMRSTAGWSRRSTWRPRSGSRRSSSRRTAWTISPCSCAAREAGTLCGRG